MPDTEMNLVKSINLHFLEIVFVLNLCVAIQYNIISSLWTYALVVLALYICYRSILRQTAGQIDVKGHGVFITGCDTGFGHDLSKQLDELGFTVFAGCLKPEGDGAKTLKSKSSKRLHIVPLDVRKDESVQVAHDYVIKHLPNKGLWAIVNNAGFNTMGDVEWLTVGMHHRLMDVNFYGAIRTIRTFLHLVRKSQGRVVFVTSVRGLFTQPGDAVYHASKYALETMTDSLRLEMKKFGVKVSKVQPGNFSNATGTRQQEHVVRYRAEANEMWANASDDVRKTYGRKYLDSKV